MIEEVEITSFDLRFESYRMKSPGAERALIASISENGIRDPLQGITTKDGRILLDVIAKWNMWGRLYDIFNHWHFISARPAGKGC